LQTVSASSASVAANAPVAPSATAVPTSHAHSFVLVNVIVSTRLSRFCVLQLAAFKATFTGASIH
jgi:hypothetical protein